MQLNKIANCYDRSFVASQGEVSIGVDITSVSRIAQLVDRHDSQTLTLVFTPNEIDRAKTSDLTFQSYSICFAAKEAVGKAMGTGLIGIDWHEIDTRNVVNPEGSTNSQLEIELSGKAKLQASKLGFTNWFANWFGWDDYILVRVMAY
jgi:holo-[acyl-carrier protein] synthase